MRAAMYSRTFLEASVLPEPDSPVLIREMLIYFSDFYSYITVFGGSEEYYTVLNIWLSKNYFKRILCC